MRITLRRGPHVSDHDHGGQRGPDCQSLQGILELIISLLEIMREKKKTILDFLFLVLLFCCVSADMI